VNAPCCCPWRGTRRAPYHQQNWKLAESVVSSASNIENIAHPLDHRSPVLGRNDLENSFEVAEKGRLW
jgi:hypothetical protein